MTSRYIEQRVVNRNGSPLPDMARHLYVRYRLGRVVVISSRPGAVLPNLRREWAKIEQFVRRERATTLQPALVHELLNTAQSMHDLKFSVDREHRGAGVHLVTAESYIQTHLTCRTMYILEQVSGAVFRKLVSSVEENGLIVSYRGLPDCNYIQFV